MPLTHFQPSQVDSSFNGYLRNRIINGAMMIDQRNAGASVTINTSNPTYTLDRWGAGATQNAKFTVQQNGGGVTPPAGYKNYLGVTSSSAYSVTASDYFYVGQRIEGLNIADLNWGSATASPVTLSFWVRSSLTGTFGGAIYNDAYNRGYPFSYTIIGANTWEYKTVTIPGDTTGTWLTTNGIGLSLTFGLGVGANNSGTAGAWAAAGEISATGATSVVGTNAATWYVTGLQLEVGSVATPFERRMYGAELQLAQRYYSKSYDIPTTPGTVTNNGAAWNYVNTSVSIGDIGVSIPLKATMRTSPTVVWYSPDTGSSGVIGSVGGDKTAISQYVGASSIAVYASANNSNGQARVHFTASAEL